MVIYTRSVYLLSFQGLKNMEKIESLPKSGLISLSRVRVMDKPKLIIP